MNSSALSGCHLHFRKLNRKELSFDITRIRSKSPALKALSMEYITFFKIWDVTIIQNFATLRSNNLTVMLNTKSNLISWPNFFYLKILLFFTCANKKQQLVSLLMSFSFVSFLKLFESHWIKLSFFKACLMMVRKACLEISMKSFWNVK